MEGVARRIPPIRRVLGQPGTRRPQASAWPHRAIPRVGQQVIIEEENPLVAVRTPPRGVGYTFGATTRVVVGAGLQLGEFRSAADG